jgi:hypothetical protein
MSGQSSYVRIGKGRNGMTWPHPDDPNEIEWQLRYGDAASVRLVAASYIAAYRQLIDMPQRERNERVSQIRAAASPSVPSSEGEQE